MSFATRHAKGSIFNCNTEGFEYKKLSELFAENGQDEVYTIQGVYINRKSNYGDSPVAICLDFFVNLPEYMLEECTDMIRSEEDVNDIKAGLVGFKIEEYEKEIGKSKKTCYGVRWVDLMYD